MIDPFFVPHKVGWSLIGCGHAKYWQLVKAGEIKVVGKGRMSRADYASIKAYAEKLRDEAGVKGDEASGSPDPHPKAKSRRKAVNASNAEAA